MDSEDQEILAKIGQLTGQINRHKNNRGTEHRTYTPTASASIHPSGETLQSSKHNTYSRAYPQANAGWRGGHPARGYRVGKAPIHRNRTLVLNGGTATPPTADPLDMNMNAVEQNFNAPIVEPAWVSKQDRHLQLINTSIFEKDSQVRAKAMEETRKLKALVRDAREKTKLTRHLQRAASSPHVFSGRQFKPGTTTAAYEINVQGIQFRVAQNGSKLVKVPGERSHIIAAYGNVELSSRTNDLQLLGDINAAKSTPKFAVVGGVKFHRSKNGNMYRGGIIKIYRKNLTVKKVNEPCKPFNTTGSCPKGPRCRYIHDHSKTAVCKEFLSKGSCPSGESCDLSHDLTPERTPACLHFAKGHCSNPQCRYSHVRVSPSAPVCRAFAVYGYCKRGADCEERHVHECPDFSSTGTCPTKGCKLPHRHKAHVMRNANRGEVSGEDQSSDLSSDDEAIDSDDVDSDDLDEEYFGEHPPDNQHMQQDYVELS
ncbi:hypothetical protein BJ875DRAFT_454220 [Amylocarpus encephaloides]|uniref:C3H1-type domain-containing protein n=1 Tax=Amylocarpus encephaloides TaxID=45428 RepID=A0A9P8C7Y2_9HELO|nr:hypothetical protein BJ875DRAFT_454220 [Amylocarpus encephaloides]